MRHDDQRWVADWKATLTCGHHIKVQRNVDWTPEQGLQRAMPARLKEMRLELAKVYAPEPIPDHDQKMLDAGWPELGTYLNCRLCPIARTVVAYEPLGSRLLLRSRSVSADRRVVEKYWKSGFAALNVNSNSFAKSSTMNDDPSRSGCRCPQCHRLVAEGSAHVDEDGRRWNHHWDCFQRAEVQRRATRDAGPTAPERSIRGRIGAYTRWANTEDRYTATRPAREAFYAKPQERAKRGEFARKAYYQRLALKSAQVRRRRKAGDAEDDRIAKVSFQNVEWWLGIGFAGV